MDDNSIDGASEGDRNPAGDASRADRGEPTGAVGTPSTAAGTAGERFTYTYSAEERSEARRILAAYAPDAEAPAEESAVEQLRALDRATRRPGRVASWAIGIAGTLTLGGGMSMTLTRPTVDAVSVWGIVIGVIGIILIILAYPLCSRITRRMREKNAPKVRALAERMLDDENHTAESE